MESVYASYRPLRIGWCVRDGNLEDLRKAWRYTHCFWGGRFNPIIPVPTGDQKFAEQLVDIFRVDVLFPLADDPVLEEFIKKFPHLTWLEHHKELFISAAPDKGNLPAVLDICHPVRRMYEAYVEDREKPKISSVLYAWEDTDPLADVFLATFGGFPPAEESRNYEKMIEKHLKAERVVLKSDAPLPIDALERLTPLEITELDLEYFPNHHCHPGLYVGSCQDFTDLFSFWNLRAACTDLLFYDPAHASRLDPLKDAYLPKLRERKSVERYEGRVGTWYKSHEAIPEGLPFGENVLKCSADGALWNGLNLIPPYVHFEEKSILGSVGEEYGKLSMTFQMVEKPFYTDTRSHLEQLVISVRSISSLRGTGKENLTFWTPDLPELNHYFGREAEFRWYAARAQHQGLGIITTTISDQFTLRALDVRSLIQEIFKAYGMKAEPSTAGLVGSQLIQQMEGLQGGRVFKITGVRELIEKYRPDQWFTRSAAIQTIGQLDVQGVPHFEEFEGLYIQKRETPKLKPEDAFKHLLDREVFRAGLALKCDRCKLEFWQSIDRLGTKVECEFCGNTFNITTQLRDRDWAYRRSGLFGRDNHQEGGIPVALTLQQIDSALHGGLLYATGMTLTSSGASITPCETDFVVLGKEYDDRLEVGIGECKTRDEITEQDVSNLTKVADAFPDHRIRPFIIFSKVSEFTPEEIKRCEKAQEDNRRRVILLSKRELEPYDIFHHTHKEFDVQACISLQDMADNTNAIYFHPRKRQPKK